MDFMDVAYVNFYREIEEEKEHKRKLNNIALYLRNHGETNENLNIICTHLGITNLTPTDMAYIQTMV